MARRYDNNASPIVSCKVSTSQQRFDGCHLKPGANNIVVYIIANMGYIHTSPSFCRYMYFVCIMQCNNYYDHQNERAYI